MNYMGVVSRLLAASPRQGLMGTSPCQSYKITQYLSIATPFIANHCITVILQDIYHIKLLQKFWLYVRYNLVVNG